MTDTTRWGDEDDESTSSEPSTSQIVQKTTAGHIIPPTHSSRIDSKGIKTVTSYKPSKNTNSLTQTTAKVKVIVTPVREHVSVEVRRKWKRFGEAANTTDDSNITIVSRDDVYMEDPNAEIEQQEDASKALAGNLNAFWAKQQKRQLERKYEVDTDDKEEEKGEEGWTKVEKTSGHGGNAAATSSGKYIPPSLRTGSTSTGKSLAEREGRGVGGDRDQNTIRVTNISEDTTEADLQDLFSNFGRISRVYLAKDKETLQSRGFAFVSFVHREHAALAMEKLQGFGYDHLILKLEWARPSAPRDPGSEGTQYRSGYGKALAQDTSDRVSYASNLTRGVRS